MKRHRGINSQMAQNKSKASPRQMYVASFHGEEVRPPGRGVDSREWLEAGWPHLALSGLGGGALHKHSHQTGVCGAPESDHGGEGRPCPAAENPRV